MRNKNVNVIELKYKPKPISLGKYRLYWMAYIISERRNVGNVEKESFDGSRRAWARKHTYTRARISTRTQSDIHYIANSNRFLSSSRRWWWQWIFYERKKESIGKNEEPFKGSDLYSRKKNSKKDREYEITNTTTKHTHAHTQMISTTTIIIITKCIYTHFWLRVHIYPYLKSYDTLTLILVSRSCPWFACTFPKINFLLEKFSQS